MDIRPVAIIKHVLTWDLMTLIKYLPKFISNEWSFQCDVRTHFVIPCVFVCKC